MTKLYVVAALTACAALAQSELKYAVIVSRHGVRSPTSAPERLNPYSAAPWPDWGVAPGYLTPRGRSLMKLMGDFYRDYFSAAGLLGNANCADARRVYIWADTDQRTLETARALAEGVAPGCEIEIHSAGEGKTDALFDPISAGVAKQDPKLAMAAVAGRLGPKPDALIDSHRAAFDALVHVLNGAGKSKTSIFEQPMSLKAGADGVSMEGPLRLASTLTENFLLEYSNGMSGDSLGWGRLNERNLQQMMTLHTAYADLMRRTPYLARARGSNLLSHVLGSLEQAAKGSAVKGAFGKPDGALTLISGHDTNLSNISGMLGLSWLIPSFQPDDAPPGGALVFSLWRSTGTGQYSVRLQFVAQTLDQMRRATPLSKANPPAIANVFVPGCSAAAEGFPCEWTAFERVLRAAIDPAFVQ